MVVLVGVFTPNISFATDCALTISGPCTVGNKTCEKSFIGGIVCTDEKGNKTDNVGNNVDKNSGSCSLILTPFAIASCMFEILSKGVGYILMTITSLILIISGSIFDTIINFTILDMSKNLGTESGIGSSITTAWETLRDVANMFFIFVLLYAAFKAMFDANFGNFQTTIKNIIIVALLINFSLFFSKVVIDASNIASVGFYKAIATSNNSSSLENTTGKFGFSGISGGYMRMLGLQNFFGAGILDKGTDSKSILIIGIMSSIFMLITAIILLIAGIMFAARFIILIFLMILSPLALVSYIIPAMKKHFDEWKEALINQSFFAPLFFAMTWVVFKLGTAFIAVLKLDQALNADSNAKWTDISTSPKGAIPLIINYVIIIGFSIAALIFSKQMASKGATAAAFSGITGGAMAGSGLALRNTVGRGSRALLNSEKIKNAASDENRSWATRTLAKSTLWTSKKGAEGSYDVRGMGNTGLSKALGGGDMFKDMGSAGGKGGFSAAVEAKTKKKAAYAKEVYGKTDKEKEDEKEIEKEVGNKDEEVKTAKEEEAEVIRTKRKTETEEIEKKKEEAKRDMEEKNERLERLQDDKLAGVTIDPLEETKFTKELQEARLNLKTITETHKLALEKQNAKIEDSEYSDKVRFLKEEAKERREALEKLKNASGKRLEAYAKRLEGTFEFAGDKAAARAVRKMIKDKTDEELVAEASERIAKKKLKEEADKNKGSDTTTPPISTPPTLPNP